MPVAKRVIPAISETTRMKRTPPYRHTRPRQQRLPE